MRMCVPLVPHSLSSIASPRIWRDPPSSAHYTFGRASHPTWAAHRSPSGGRENERLAAAAAVDVVYRCTELDWKRPLCTRALEGKQGVILALGKFDAMHRGHRLLAETAASMNGYPCLLSFWGMAEVLGLPARRPLTAEPDRLRVLQTWAPHCDGLTPLQRDIPFASIRHLGPEEFVRVLAEDMQVLGVVAGSNYRFGYKAAGDAHALQSLATRHGLKVKILELRGTHEPGLVGPASSTKVRECLRSGRVRRIISYLDRPYSLLVPCDAVHAARACSSGSPAEGSAAPHAAQPAESVPARDSAAASAAPSSARPQALDPGGPGAGSGDAGLDNGNGLAASGSGAAALQFGRHACLNELPRVGEYRAAAYVAGRGGPEERLAALLCVGEDVCTLSCDSFVDLSGPYLRIELLDSTILDTCAVPAD